jgi:hypothetical protein
MVIRDHGYTSIFFLCRTGVKAFLSITFIDPIKKLRPFIENLLQEEIYYEYIFHPILKEVSDGTQDFCCYGFWSSDSLSLFPLIG